MQDSVDLTPEQASSLYSLYEQLSENGIMLYNTQGADDLVFPSGADHSQRVSVTPTVIVQNGGTGTITLSLAHPAQNTVTVSWRIADGSATGTICGKTSGAVIFVAGEQSKTLTVQATSSSERWNGNRAFVVEFYDVDGALFSNGTRAASTTVLVSKDYTYPSLTEGQSKSGYRIYFFPIDRAKSEEAELVSDMSLVGVVGLDGPFTFQYSTSDYLSCRSKSKSGMAFDWEFYHSGKKMIACKLYSKDNLREAEFSYRIKYPENLLPQIQDGILTSIGYYYAYATTSGWSARDIFSLNGTQVYDHSWADRYTTTSISNNDIRSAPVDPQKDYFTETRRFEVQQVNKIDAFILIEIYHCLPFVKRF